ncbi:MAG TPA: hypothetical protein VIK54_16620 [Acidimicrobiia bacterium]
MQSMPSAQSWLRPHPTWFELNDPELPNDPELEESRIQAAERGARHEIARLRREIEQLVRVEDDDPRGAVDSALVSLTRLQVVTANLDACTPPSASFAGAPMVALADAHLRGHSDAIERGMTYTADNQLRLLHPER